MDPMIPLYSVEENMRRARGVTELIGGNKEERYVVPQGAEVVIKRGGEVVANVYAPRDPPPVSEGLLYARSYSGWGV